MNDPIAMLEWLVDAQQGIPTLAEMPRRTLSDKGIAGPTAAHVIEEIHTPLNLALVTFTTGSSAFQNIVGVTQNELLLRSAAGKRVLAECGVTAGQHMVVTYAPLVNVFTRQALDESGLHWSFYPAHAGTRCSLPCVASSRMWWWESPHFTRHAGTGAKDEPAGVFTKNADADYRRHPLMKRWFRCALHWDMGCMMSTVAGVRLADPGRPSAAGRYLAGRRAAGR